MTIFYVGAGIASFIIFLVLWAALVSGKERRSNSPFLPDDS